MFSILKNLCILAKEILLTEIYKNAILITESNRVLKLLLQKKLGNSNQISGKQARVGPGLKFHFEPNIRVQVVAAGHAF